MGGRGHAMTSLGGRDIDDQLIKFGDHLLSSFEVLLREQLAALGERLQQRQDIFQAAAPPLQVVRTKSPLRSGPPQGDEHPGAVSWLVVPGEELAGQKGGAQAQAEVIAEEPAGQKGSARAEVPADEPVGQKGGAREEVPPVQHSEQAHADAGCPRPAAPQDKAEGQSAQGAAPDRPSCLCSAASRNDPEAVRQLLQAKCAVDDVCPSQGVPSLKEFDESLESDLATYKPLPGAPAPPNPKCITPLSVASFYGCAKVAAVLCEAGATVDDPRGQSRRVPLAVAASRGHLAVMQCLCQHGATLGQRDCRGLTPMHLAAEAGAVEAVQYLSKAGADKGSKADNGFTPVHSAMAGGHMGTLRCLLGVATEAEIADRRALAPLHAAATMDHPGFVWRLIQARCAINELQSVRGHPMLRSLCKHFDANGAHFWFVHRSETLPYLGLATPLMAACYHGHVGVVEALLDARAALDQEGSLEYTPTNTAACAGHLEVVQLLDRRGAILGKRHCFGGSPLHSAACSCHDVESGVEVVRYLCSRGVDVDGAEHDGMTPLHLAARWGLAETLRVLLHEVGANKEARADKGLTPLHWAALSGHAEVVELLYEAGVDRAAETLDGHCPFQLAAVHGHVEVLRYMVKTGTPVNKPRRNNQTALHKAAFYGKLDALRYLLEARAHVDSAAAFGTTPLHCAAQQGYPEVVRALLESGSDETARQRQASRSGGKTAEALARTEGHQSVVRLLTFARLQTDIFKADA